METILNQGVELQVCLPAPWCRYQHVKYFRSAHSELDRSLEPSMLSTTNWPPPVPHEYHILNQSKE